ncbi:MAG TPA: haloacid dehalogenase type II, partial [Pirellulales bacterium]|nr:haloacid dehalogenase type II [Pirellulales bacterium]
MSDASIQRQPIEALLFDVFGTVVDWRGSLVAWFERFGLDRGCKADWPELVDDWRAAYQPALEPIRRGVRPFVTLDVLHRESLDALLPKFALEDVSNADRQRMVRAWHALEPWPDAVPGLARLKCRFVVASLSNGGVRLQIELSKHAGLPWDAIFSADHFRQYKPEGATYLGAVELLGCSTTAVIMVAAHPSDLAAARTYGLRTALVARPLEYGPRKMPHAEPAVA